MTDVVQAWLMTNVQSGDVDVTVNPDGWDREMWHRAPLVLAATTAPQPVALTDEQRIDWLCEEAEFTCGQWQVVIDSDKESFLDAVDEMARTAHGITQPSQQERT